MEKLDQLKVALKKEGAVYIDVVGCHHERAGIVVVLKFLLPYKVLAHGSKPRRPASHAVSLAEIQA